MNPGPPAWHVLGHVPWPVTAHCCLLCGHPPGWHVAIGLSQDPSDGGVMICPRCPCAFPWADEGPMPLMPSWQAVQLMRVIAFGMM